jgi:peroxiredoxin
MPRSKDFLAGIFIGLGIGLGWYFGFGPGRVLVAGWFEKGEGWAARVPEKNQPAIDFSLPSLEGKEFRLQDYAGKPVIINFWATWCTPCREEMPLIENYYRQHSSNVAVLAINDGDSLASVRSFVDEMGLSFPILLDQDSQVSRLYKVLALPTTLFIDQNGILRYQHTGSLTEEQLLNYLEELNLPSS